MLGRGYGRMYRDTSIIECNGLILDDSINHAAFHSFRSVGRVMLQMERSQEQCFVLVHELQLDRLLHCFEVGISRLTVIDVGMGLQHRF